MDWIRLTDETPVHGPWRMRGFATIHVAGYPVAVHQGSFMTYGELLRAYDFDRLKYAPYTKYIGEKYHLDEIMFLSDENNYVYPAKVIVAWMPMPEPYQLKSNEGLCCSCGRLFVKERDNQDRCPECEERYAQSILIREKLKKFIED